MGNEVEKEQTKQHPIVREVESFIQHIDSLESSIVNVMLSLSVAELGTRGKYNSYLENFGKKLTIGDSSDEGVRYRLEPELIKTFEQKAKDLDRTEIATKLLPKIYIIALVSQHDAFIWNILLHLFTTKPELLHSSGRELSYVQLEQAENLLKYPVG